MTLWVIYDHPKDFPDSFVVRRQFVLEDSSIAFEKFFVIAPSLDLARLQIPHGLYNIGRQPEDDAVIAEVWI